MTAIDEPVEPPAEDEVLVAFGTDWRYDDNGTQRNGTGWRQQGFNDGGWSVGVKDYAIDGIGDDVQVVAWHQDQVTELPVADVEVVGSSSFCRYAALAYGDRAWTIQPHPEFSTDYMADLVDTRGQILPREIADKALASRDRAVSSNRIADHIRTFFKMTRSAP